MSSSIQDKIYQYFERDPELRVLFLFKDAVDWVTLGELDGAEWPVGYRYVHFKGDWFTTKVMLDGEWAGDKVVIYCDQVSPLTQKSLQADFPLMDVLAANMEFHHQDYAAFIQQYGLPVEMSRFVEKNIQTLQSASVHRLLHSYYADGSINQDIATRGILSAYMGASRVLDWDSILLRVLLQGRESETSKQADFFRRLTGAKMILADLEQRFTAIFGVGLDQNRPSRVERIVKVMKYNAITQNLAPVANDNYQSTRIKEALALQQMNRLLELALSTPKSATALQETFKELAADIRDESLIEWYGTEANYYYQPYELCVPILRGLLREALQVAPNTVIRKVEGMMVKNLGQGLLGAEMDFAVMSARYYEYSKDQGSFTLSTPDEYVARYQSDFYQIDQLYRLAVAAYYQCSPASPLFEIVQEAKAAIDVDYAKKTNLLNLEWLRCVKECGGMKSVNLMRQQDFYDSTIRPQQKKVAVIVSDALRYELAASLVEELAKSRHTAKLGVALAMLPTETKFCKPALLPHRSMTIYGDGSEINMSVDQKLLDCTEKRTAQLQTYKDGAICVRFKDVSKYVQDTNREIFKHPLVYIFHNHVDDECHGAQGSDVVAACQKAIKDIATMIPKIHATYNVTEVYVVADHGFLFNDMEFADKDKQPITEETLERKSRYYLTNSEYPVSGVCKFALGDVSGIENSKGIYVAVPEGTNRMMVSGGDYVFAHGGASLQEMLIPVITSRQEREDNKQPVGVMVLDRNLAIQASRLRFNLLQTDAVSMECKERTVTVALYQGDTAVTPIKQITLDKTDGLLDNRKYPVDLTLNKSVQGQVLQLRVYDVLDNLNPLIKENVTNKTLIENDFDF